MKNIFVFISSFFITVMSSAQPSVYYTNENLIYTDEDKQIYNQYISYISPITQILELDELLEKTASFFLTKPYVAHTLENEGEESVVVNLREFDCTTYIETVVALTQTVRSEDHSFENFIKKLEAIRYREGKLAGYSSRLHYFSDWLYDNEKSGVLKNFTMLIGGITEEKQLNFMSTHRNAYSQLKFNDNNLSGIIDIEKEINERGGMSYIPKSKIFDINSRIPHMSIIAFATSINGLDVTHTGFAYQKDGKLTFIHASSAKNKVIIDSSTVSEYCNLQKTCTGIIVAKLL
ncbi:MAG: DUF1460 domain-containing protein [Fermentimonas sp.]|nr:DUF1460 domain-containing protein [Fermentimonas sp.]